MKLTSFLLPLSLLCLTLAQQPGDHTVPTTTPTLSVLACSDRDSSTSALESCTKYHTPGLEYTPECTDLFWLQGLFSTCTIAVTVTKTSGMVTSTITKGPSPTIIRSTKRIRRTITAFSVMPKEDDTTTVTEYVTAATMNMNDQTKDVLGPAVPEYLPRWPREECLDPDYCPVEFSWSGIVWNAESGICGLCKDYEAKGFAGLPYNVRPWDMKIGLCHQWQPPSSYDC